MGNNKKLHHVTTVHLPFCPLLQFKFELSVKIKLKSFHVTRKKAQKCSQTILSCWISISKLHNRYDPNCFISHNCQIFFLFVSLGIHQCLYFPHLSDISRALNAICLRCLHSPSLSPALCISLLFLVSIFLPATHYLHISLLLISFYSISACDNISHSLFLHLSASFVSHYLLFQSLLFFSQSSGSLCPISLGIIISSTFSPFLSHITYVSATTVRSLIFFSSSHLHFLRTFLFSNHNTVDSPRCVSAFVETEKGPSVVLKRFLFLFFIYFMLTAAQQTTGT